MKTHYTVQDDGEDFEVSMFLGDIQIGGALIPQFIGEDQALILARNLGEAFLQSTQSAPGGYPRAPDRPLRKGKRR